MFVKHHLSVLVLFASLLYSVRGQVERHRRGLMYRRRVSEHTEILMDKEVPSNEVRMILYNSFHVRDGNKHSAPVFTTYLPYYLIFYSNRKPPQMNMFWKRVLMSTSMVSLPPVAGIEGGLGKAGKKSKGGKSGKAGKSGSKLMESSKSSKSKGKSGKSSKGTGPPSEGLESSSGKAGKAGSKSKGKSGATGPPSASIGSGKGKGGRRHR